MAKTKKQKAPKDHALTVIDKALAAAGLPRRYLVEKLEITEQSLCGWWIRNKFPRERIGDVASALGIDPGDLAPDLAALFRAGWVPKQRQVRAAPRR